MKASIISFTKQGGLLAAKAAGLLAAGQEAEVEVFALEKYAALSGVSPLRCSLKSWCGSRWDQDDLILFVGAAGIAVRSIAPFVKSKTTDPAVLAMDERGNFVISLLSGHIGGGNAAAKALAEGLGAVPVITTATDCNGLFAVDEWAVNNKLAISSMKLAKEAASCLLQGKKIPLYLDECISYEGEIPEELRLCSREDLLKQKGICIAVTNRRLAEEDHEILYLIPGNLTLGIGCRRGKEKSAIKAMAEKVLDQYALFPQALVGAATIDLKKDEDGILSYLREQGLPLQIYTAEELSKAPGEFSSSAFVSSITGVDNVCERAASLSGGSLIVKKQAENGVTIAVSERKVKVRFWAN